MYFVVIDCLSPSSEEIIPLTAIASVEIISLTATALVVKKIPLIATLFVLEIIGVTAGVAVVVEKIPWVEIIPLIGSVFDVEIILVTVGVVVE